MQYKVLAYAYAYLYKIQYVVPILKHKQWNIETLPGESLV